MRADIRRLVFLLEAIIGPEVLTKGEAGTLTRSLQQGGVRNPNTDNDRTPPSKVTHMANVRILYAIKMTLKELQGNPDVDPICLKVIESAEEFFDGVTGRVSSAKAFERLQAVLGAQAAPRTEPQGLPAATPVLMGPNGPPVQATVPPAAQAQMANSPPVPPAV